MNHHGTGSSWPRLGEKIIVIGSPGAGKSTLAREISRVTGIELYHLDRIFWLPGWVPVEHDEFIEKQLRIMQGSSWIIDGNYQSSLRMRIDASDTIILLDLPRFQCMYRAVKRSTLHRRKKRPDITEGCTEKIDRDFLNWIWNYRTRDRPETLETIMGTSGKNVIILEKSSEVRNFLDSLRKNATVD